MEQGEIILYQPDESLRLEVRLERDNVWLNRLQLAELFDRDVKTIGKHINNALKEELDNVPVVAKFATTAADGKIYQTEHYNLDMVISVGFRVKSRRGVDFRRWANTILKDYMLKGYSINQHLNDIGSELLQIKSTLSDHDEKIKFFVRTSLPPVEGIFYGGQIFDAYTFASDLIRSAKKSILLIDNYVDDTVLLMLSKRKPEVSVTIYTRRITPQLQLDLEKHNEQYPSIHIKIYKESHDRFLVVDGLDVYHIGASLKDLGKKLFAFSKMNGSAKLIEKFLE